MALFKVFHAVDEEDLPLNRVSGNSYIIDDEEKDFLQWKVDVGTDNDDRRGIASEGLIYGDGVMVRPEAITPTAFAQVRLLTGGWTTGNNVLTQTVTIEGLKCGKNGDIPPIIQCISNKEDYSRIDSAMVNGENITFTILGTDAPSSNIELTIIDF